MKHTKSTALLQFNNVILTLYLLLISNAIFAPIYSSFDQKLLEESATIKIAKYVPLILLLIFNFRSIRISRLSSLEKQLFIVSLYFFASTLWSPSASSTFLYSIQFLLSLIAFYIINNIRQLNILYVLKCYLVIITISSLLFRYLKPDLALMEGEHEGLLRGIFIHKNILGATIVATLPIILLKRNIISFDTVLIAYVVYIVYLTGSSTSLLCMLIITLMSFSIKYFNRTTSTALFSVFIILVIYIAFNFHDFILKQLNKSSDLTGRLVLWQNIVDAIYKHPLLGWGYYGFWKSSASTHAFIDMAWVTSKAHNAFLDILLSGGFVLLVFSIAFLIRLLLFILKIKDNNIRTFSLLSFMSVVILSLTEMNLFEHNSLNLFILYYIISQNKYVYNSKKLLPRSFVPYPTKERLDYTIMYNEP